MTIKPIPLKQQWPFVGTHLQTVRMNFRNDHPDVSQMNPSAIQVPMNDGTGDIMTGVIHTPPKQRYPGLLVVAGHGFGGDADSAYMKWITKFFFDQDIAVCRLNLRGAGNSRPLCRDNYHGARGEDLIRFWDWLLSAKEPAVPFKVTRTYFAGTSLSGSVLANAFAQIDDKSVGTASDLSGVIGGLGLCFAFDMQTSARKIHSAMNWPYLQYLLGKVKPLFDVQPGLDQATKTRIAAATSLIDIDDIWTAPHLGFASAFEFYKHASGRLWVPHAKRPFRVVATLNDPWIDPQGFLDADWSNPLLEPKMFTHGGHCGLWERGHRYQRHFREALDHIESLLGPADAS